MSSTPFIVEWHEENLATLKNASNGNRNDQLNKLAMASFQLALGDGLDLTIGKVESDFEGVGLALGLEKHEVMATLKSALEGAKRKPRDIDIYAGKTETIEKPIDKSELVVEPTFGALAEYAIAHGVPETELLKAKWELSEYENRPCFKVPHEDGVIRCRFTDGNKPKWKPIGTGIKPCWYGFNRAVEMASKHSRKMIVITNGQPSVIAAQYHGIPALAQTDGEGKKIELPLLKRLLDAIKEHNLVTYLCYDGDNTGRESTKKISEQLLLNGIKARVVYFGGDDHFDLADFCKLHGQLSSDKLHQLSLEKATENNKGLKGLSGSECLDDIMADNENKTISSDTIPIPFKSFHKLGGYAYSLPSGKMALIMAISGGGKTSLLETWAEYWLKDGIDVLFYTPEWTLEELIFRYSQRNGGATYDEIMSLITYRQETRNGVPKEKRRGKLFSPELKSKTMALTQARKNWKGELFYFPQNNDVNKLLDSMLDTVCIQRREGRRMVVIIDYIQMLTTTEVVPGKSQYELIINTMKDWCIEYDVAMFVGSQVLKNVGNNNGDRLLNEYDSQWVRPDAFKLIVTLNTKEIDEIGPGGLGVKRRSEHAIANICKNSTGQLGQIDLMANFKYLTWKEK